jgi:hypothetical protein
MLAIHTAIDELVIIDTPLSNDDITLYALNGLSTDYKDIYSLYEPEKHH